MSRRKDSAPTAGPSKAKLATAKFYNSNRTMAAAMAFFGLVLVALVYVYWPTGGDEPGTAVAAPVSTPTPTPTPPPTPSADGAVNGCLPQDAVDVPPEKLVLTEFSTQWKAIGQMSIPGSSDGGPRVQDPPHCFTRTPEGSLYSIATFFAERAQAGSNQGFVDVMGRRCLHDSNYDAYTARLLSDTPVTGVPVTAISGYRWMEYTPERATVELQFRLVTGPDAGKTTSNVFSVIWSNNDWLILVPHPDQPTAVPGNNLRTFRTWGATG